MATLELSTLMNVEGHTEKGLAAMLAQRTGIKSFPAYSKDRQEMPRLEVTIGLGAETGHYWPNAIVNGKSAPVQDAWDYTLSVKVITNREARNSGESNQTSITHRAAVGKVRAAMLYILELLTPAVLPYHQLATVVHQGANPSVESADDEDVTEMTYTGTVGIRSEVWALTIV